MNDDRARELLRAERARVEDLLESVSGDGQSDRSAANEQGDMSDSSELLVSEGTDDAVANALIAATRGHRTRRTAPRRRHLRADRSPVATPFPMNDFEADPAAELTVDEAERS